eukprot:4833467-Pleurochrysis_carterae.AAC.1
MLLGLKWSAVTSSAFTEHRTERSEEERTCLQAPWTASANSPASGVASGMLALLAMIEPDLTRRGQTPPLRGM